MKPRTIFAVLFIIILAAGLWWWWWHPTAPGAETLKSAVAGKPASPFVAAVQVAAPVASPMPAKEGGDAEASVVAATDPRTKIDTTMQYYIRMLQAGDYVAYYRAYFNMDELEAWRAKTDQAEMEKIDQMLKEQHPELVLPELTPEQRQKNEEAWAGSFRQFVQGPDGKAALKALLELQKQPIPEGAEKQSIVSFRVLDPDTGADWNITFHKEGSFWVPYFPPRRNVAANN